VFVSLFCFGLCCQHKQLQTSPAAARGLVSLHREVCATACELISATIYTVLIVAMVSGVQSALLLLCLSCLLLMIVCMCRWHNGSKQAYDRPGTNHTPGVHPQRCRQCSSRPGTRHCMCYILTYMILTPLVYNVQ